MRYWKAKLSKNWRFYNAAKTHGHKECYNAKKSNFRFFRFFSIFLGWIMKYNLVGMPSKVVYVFSEYIGSVLVCFWRKTSNFWWFFIAASTHIGKKRQKRDFSIFRFFRDFYAVKWSRTWLACQTKFIYLLRGVFDCILRRFEQKRAKIDDFTTLRKRMVTRVL